MIILASIWHRVGTLAARGAGQDAVNGRPADARDAVHTVLAEASRDSSAERYNDELAERHFRELAGRDAGAQRPCTECGQAAGDWHDPGCRNDPALAGFYMLGPEPGEDAARWTPEMDAPDHLYGAPECTEPDPETDHFGHAARVPEDAGRFPLPRILESAPPSLAPVASTLPDGTPHADPFLAGRGWQAQGGVYVRQPQAQMEAG